MSGVVTYQQLYALKEEHAFHKIIYVSFEGMEFVLRSLGREEYNQIASIVRDPKDLEDVIAQAALIYPEEYNMATATHAGIPEYLANVVTTESNVSDMESLIGMLNNSKAIANRFDYQCLTIIKAAMPEYDFEDMQKWTWEKIMFYTALAQKVLNLTLPADEQIDIIGNKKAEEQIADTVDQEKKEKEFVDDLRKQGIDPMFYYYNNGTIKHNLIDDPLLGGRHWNDEGVLNEIRRTIHERRHRRNGARK